MTKGNPMAEDHGTVSSSHTNSGIPVIPPFDAWRPEFPYEFRRTDTVFRERHTFYRNRCRTDRLLESVQFEARELSVLLTQFESCCLEFETVATPGSIGASGPILHFSRVVGRTNKPKSAGSFVAEEFDGHLKLSRSRLPFVQLRQAIAITFGLVS